MKETNETNKKENFFKKVVNSKTAKMVVQIGTTVLALADTAFLIWAYFDGKSDVPNPVVPDNGVTKELEVKTSPNQEVVNF